jgi:hypothetical protein
VQSAPRPEVVRDIVSEAAALLGYRLVALRHGDPWPAEWLRDRLGALRIPATLVPCPPDLAEQAARLWGPSRTPGSLAPVRRPGPWPVDSQGRPWPRTVFGQPQRPLSEFPPGHRAPGEAIPPGYRLGYFDVNKHDPIAAWGSLQPVMADPARPARIGLPNSDSDANASSKRTLDHSVAWSQPAPDRGAFAIVPLELADGIERGRNISPVPSSYPTTELADLRDWRDVARIIYSLICWKRFPDEKKYEPPPPPAIARHQRQSPTRQTKSNS